MTALGPLLGLLAAALLPVLGASDYVLGVATSACCFTVGAAALNLVYGYAGLLSFAQLAFWGIGGYCTALAVTDWGVGFWGGMAIAAGLNAGLAVVVGIPALRLNRHSFVIVTLSFSLLTALVARDWVTLTRGPLGIAGLPRPVLAGFAFDTPARMYGLALGFAALALGLLYAVAGSRLGRTLRALKGNEPLAMAQGIAPTRYKLMAFAVAAAMTGAAGGLFTFHLRVVDPLILDFYYMQAFLVIVIVGGPGHFWAVVVAGAALSALPEMLRVSNDLRLILYGAVLLGCVMAMPGGVAGAVASRRVSRARRDAVAAERREAAPA